MNDLLAEREKTHGVFLENASYVERVLSVVEGNHFSTLPYDMKQSLRQIFLKISRILSGDETFVDHWDDIAGYAKLISDRLRPTEKETESPLAEEMQEDISTPDRVGDLKPIPGTVKQPLSKLVDEALRDALCLP